MMHIRMSSGVEYVRRLWKLSVKFVASCELVSLSHALDTGHEKLCLWISTVERTVIS